MKSHVEVPVAALLALCDFSEHFIINEIRRDPKKSFAKDQAVIDEIRHIIAEANRPNPNQKELLDYGKGSVSIAKRQKRNVRTDDAKVLQGVRKGGTVRAGRRSASR